MSRFKADGRVMRSYARLPKEERKKLSPKVEKELPSGSQERLFRDGELMKLGFLSYGQYLNSSLWKRLRDDKIYHHPRCLLCDNKVQHIHHLDYSVHTLLGMCRGLLVGLCATHHYVIEFDGDVKCTLAEANENLKTLALALRRTGWLNAVEVAYKRLRQMKERVQKIREMPPETRISICLRCVFNQIKHGEILCKHCKAKGDDLPIGIKLK